MPQPESAQPGHASVQPKAILLVGPTGSGKTPLGDLLEAKGLWGRRCAHFDFGANLRRCAAGEGPAGLLSREERALLARVLKSGALLEDEHFPVARKILSGFLGSRCADGRTLVVLNGLPRHAGQARDVASLVTVERVVHLACRAEVVPARIRTNVGGDRTDRPDDAAEALGRRLAVFEERTAPLLAYYRNRGTPVETIEVGADTTADGMRERLERRAAGPWDRQE